MGPAAKAFASLVVALSSLASTLSAQPPAPPPAQGRGTGAPQPPANLQLLAKDIGRAELLAIMRSFTTGLGVTCDHCHAQGQNGRNDFASDELPSKQLARAMMRMVGQVNQAIAAAQPAKPAADVVKVECATCHRGLAIPKI